MRKNKIIYLVLFLCGFGVFMYVNDMKKIDKQSIAAYIDIVKIFQQYTEDIQEDLEVEFLEKKNELNEIQDKIKLELDQDIKNDMQEEMVKKVELYNSEYSEKVREIDYEVSKKIIDASNHILNEEGYDIVFPKSAVISSKDDSLDITDKVIKLLEDGDKE